MQVDLHAATTAVLEKGIHQVKVAATCAASGSSTYFGTRIYAPHVRALVLPA